MIIFTYSESCSKIGTNVIFIDLDAKGMKNSIFPPFTTEIKNTTINVKIFMFTFICRVWACPVRKFTILWFIAFLNIWVYLLTVSTLFKIWLQNTGLKNWYKHNLNWIRIELNFSLACKLFKIVEVLTLFSKYSLNYQYRP